MRNNRKQLASVLGSVSGTIATLLFFIMPLHAGAATTTPEIAAPFEISSTTLVFLGNQNIAPVVFNEDNAAAGVAVDMIRALAPFLSKPVDIIAMDWPTAQTLVAAGKADALIQINATEERKKIYDFSDPFLESQFSVFSLATRVEISGLASIHGMRVGVEKGGLPEAVLAAHPEIQLVVIPNFLDGFKQVTNGSLDAVVVDNRVGLYTLAKNNIQGIHATGDPIASSYSAIAVKKGNTKLLAEINAGLKAIRTNGMYQAIINKWAPTQVVVQTQEQITRDILVAVIVALSILFAVLVAWTVTMNRELARRKAAEDKLRETSAEIQDLYERAPCGYHSLDKDGVFVRMNETELSWLGYTREEVLGKLKFLDVVTEESKKTFKENFPKFLAAGEIRDLEFEMIRKDGSTLSVLASATAITDKDGKYLMSRSSIYDITERKRIAGALRESEEKFSVAYHISPNLMAITRLDNGQIVDVNEGYTDLLGYTREESLGKTTAELAIWGDANDRAIFVKSLQDTGKVDNLETKLRRKDGALRDVIDAARVFEINGEKYALSVAYDVTERNRIAGALRESEEKYRTLIQKIQAAVVVHGPDTRILSSNMVAQDLLGLTEDQMFGKAAIDPAWKFFREDGREADVSEYPVNKVISLGKPLRNYVLRVHRPGKENDVWVLINADPVTNERGEIEEVIVTFVDITARKEAESALTEVAARLNEAQHMAHVGNWELNLKSNVLVWSDEIYRMFEIDKEKFGATYDAFLGAIHPDDREAVNAAYTRSLETKKPYTIDHRLLLSGERIKYVHEECETFYDSDGKALRSVGTVQDITERKLEEERLRELDKLKDDFLMVTTHELKSPLLPIKSQAQLLLAGDYGELSQEQKGAIDMVLRNEEAINGLASDLLDISKLKSGKLKLDLENTDVGALIAEVVGDMQSLAAQKQITLSLSSVPEMPSVMVDGLRIRQIVRNLLDNALKFTPEGGTITVDVQKTGGEVLVRVKDTGTGIAKDDINKLFVPFFRVESDVTRKHRGTGLGLAVSKGLVESHGGTIRAESEGIDKGSTFTFSLPIGSRSS